MIDYRPTWKELSDFAESYASAATYREKGLMAKKMYNKIKAHYIKEKEFSENILPHKIELMKLASDICRDQHGTRNTNKVIEIYNLLVGTIRPELETQKGAVHAE